jgi:hypothetical protein
MLLLAAAAAACMLGLLRPFYCLLAVTAEDLGSR